MAIGRYMSVSGVALLVSLWGCDVPMASGPRISVPPRDRALAERLNEEGLTLVSEGCCAEAISKFRSAVEADLYFGPGHCNLGVTLLQQGTSFYEAACELRDACRLMPKAGQPRANLGILYELVGRYGEAEEHLRAALRFSPDDIEIIGHLARVHVRQNKRTEETLAWLQTIATQDDKPAWRSWAGEQLTRIENPNPQNRR